MLFPAKHTAKLQLLLMILCIILASCGQSDSVSSTDKTAPYIVSSNVPENAVDVEPLDALQIVFSESINPSTLDLSAIELNGSTGPVTGTVTASGAITRYQPDLPLALKSRFTLSVSNHVTDIAGNALSNRISWDFTTRDGVWSSAELLADAWPLSYQIGGDRAGNLFVVWSEPSGVFSRKYNIRSGWENPIKIISTSRGGRVLLAVSRDGSAIVLQPGDSNNGGSIEAVRYSPNSGWGPLENVGALGTISDVVFDANGNILLVTEASTMPFTRVGFSKFSPAQGWSPLAFIDSNTSDTGLPRLFTDNNGDTFCVWFASIAGTYASRYSSNSGWSSPEKIGTNADSTPVISYDPNGNAMLLWSQQNDQNKYVIFSKTYKKQTGWGTSTAISNPALDCFQPSLSSDGNGGFMAVWTQFDASGEHRIYGSNYTAADGWKTPVLVGTGGTSAKPVLGTDESGNAIAVWQHFLFDPVSQINRPNIFANRYVAGSGWGVQQQLSASTSFPDAPLLFVDGRGYAVSAWIESGSKLITTVFR